MLRKNTFLCFRWHIRILYKNMCVGFRWHIRILFKNMSLCFRWPFSYGIGILGGASALTGIYINNFCRRQLGLMHIARLSTYFPTVALPVVISTLFHNMLVTNKILVGEFPCTVCAATRSGTIQSLAGALYPIVLGPLVCIANARKYNTYYIPGIRDAAEVLPFLRRIMPGPSVLLGLILVNFAVGMAISERETLLFAKFLNPTTATLETEEEAPFQ